MYSCYRVSVTNIVYIITFVSLIRMCVIWYHSIQGYNVICFSFPKPLYRSLSFIVLKAPVVVSDFHRHAPTSNKCVLTSSIRDSVCCRYPSCRQRASFDIIDSRVQRHMFLFSKTAVPFSVLYYNAGTCGRFWFAPPHPYRYLEQVCFHIINSGQRLLSLLTL